MPETVTIQLSDGQPFTATPDSDRWIILPRGAKPAEPWFSACEAQFGGESGFTSFKGKIHRAEFWEWGDRNWFRIRPTEGRSWSDIAPKQPAEPQDEKHITPSADVARLTAERDALLAVCRALGIQFTTSASGKLTLNVSRNSCPADESRQSFFTARTVMEREGGAA